MTNAYEGTGASAPIPDGAEGTAAATDAAAATGTAPATSEVASAVTEPISTEGAAEADALPAMSAQAVPAAPTEATPGYVAEAPGTPGTPAGSVTEATPRSPRRRDRALGTTGQVAAVVGIVVSLVLIVGVLLGRGWLVGKVDDVAATIDGGLARGVPLLDKASTRVSEVSGRVGAVADAAKALAANPNPAPGLSEALLGQMTPISDRYLALRSSYTDVRTTVGSALDRLSTLDQLLPWISIPQGPTDALQRLDARVQAIDATVTDLLDTPGAGAVNTIAAAIATKAEDVQARLATVTTALDDASARLAALRVNVQTKADQAKLIITLASIVLILAFIYSAFLHWVLFRASSGRRRRTPSV